MTRGTSFGSARSVEVAWPRFGAISGLWKTFSRHGRPIPTAFGGLCTSVDNRVWACNQRGGVMGFDLIELVLLAGIVLGFVGLALAIFWPFERHSDDVMARVHGDQPELPDLKRLPQ